MLFAIAAYAGATALSWDSSEATLPFAVALAFQVAAHLPGLVALAALAFGAAQLAPAWRAGRGRRLAIATGLYLVIAAVLLQVTGVAAERAELAGAFASLAGREGGDGSVWRWSVLLWAPGLYAGLLSTVWR